MLLTLNKIPISSVKVSMHLSMPRCFIGQLVMIV